jgi:hypothetical protein
MKIALVGAAVAAGLVQAGTAQAQDWTVKGPGWGTPACDGSIGVPEWTASALTWNKLVADWNEGGIVGPDIVGPDIVGPDIVQNAAGAAREATAGSWYAVSNLWRPLNAVSANSVIGGWELNWSRLKGEWNSYDPGDYSPSSAFAAPWAQLVGVWETFHAYNRNHVVPAWNEVEQTWRERGTTWAARAAGEPAEAVGWSWLAAAHGFEAAAGAWAVHGGFARQHRRLSQELQQINQLTTARWSRVEEHWQRVEGTPSVSEDDLRQWSLDSEAWQSLVGDWANRSKVVASENARWSQLESLWDDLGGGWHKAAQSWFAVAPDRIAKWTPLEQANAAAQGAIASFWAAGFSAGGDSGSLITGNGVWSASLSFWAGPLNREAVGYGWANLCPTSGGGLVWTVTGPPK